MIKNILKKALRIPLLGKRFLPKSKLEKQITGFIGDGVAPYHVDYLKTIAPLVKNKTVLEIGGSNFQHCFI